MFLVYCRRLALRKFSSGIKRKPMAFIKLRKKKKGAPANKFTLKEEPDVATW
jgi:hypothetical protein